MESAPPDDPYLTLKSCAEALEADPEDPHLLAELAGAQEAIGAILDALSSYEHALRFFLSDGAQVDAARICNKILAIDPNHQLALEQLTQLFTKEGARLGATTVGREVSVTELESRSQRGPVRRVLTPSVGAISVHDADIIEERSVPRVQPPSGRERKRPASGGERQNSSKQPMRTAHGYEQGPRLPHRKGAPAPDPSSAPAPTKLELSPWLPEELLASGTLRQLERHELLCREHEQANALALLVSGSLELAKRGQVSRRVVLERLAPGAIFGELALLGDGKWHVTARALDPAVVRLLPRDKVLALLGENPEATKALRRLYRDRLQQGLLKTSLLLRRLPQQEALTFLRRCKPLGIKSGQVVVQQSAPATGFYLVLLGELTVTMMPKKGREPLLLGVLRDGDFFGEIALIYNQPATATLTAVGFAQLLHLPAGEFHRFSNDSATFLQLLEEEAKRRERDNRAIMRGVAYFDERRGTVKPVERPAKPRR